MQKKREERKAKQAKKKVGLAESCAACIDRQYWWDEWLEAWRQHKWWTFLFVLFLHVKTSLLAEFFFLSECTATRLQKQTRGRSQRRRSANQKASHVMGGWTPFTVAPLRIFEYLWGIPLLFVTLPPLLYSLYIIHLWYSPTASLPYTPDTVMCSIIIHCILYTSVCTVYIIEGRYNILYIMIMYITFVSIDLYS